MEDLIVMSIWLAVIAFLGMVAVIKDFWGSLGFAIFCGIFWFEILLFIERTVI
jgi:hypothetical protein